MNKRQTSVSFAQKTLDKLNSLQSLEKSKSRNVIIEDAIDFYYGYMTSEINQDFLCSVYGRKVEGVIGNNVERIAHLMFKEAVGINVLTRLMAAQFEIDKTTYERIRLAALNDTKATKGIISIYDAQR